MLSRIIGSFLLGLCFRCASYVQAQGTDLYLGDINFAILTDMHGFVAGTQNDPSLDADYGSVLSFVTQMRNISSSLDQDVFYINNGDFVSGSGFSGNPPTALTPIMEKFPWDLINIGEHEISHRETVEFLLQPGGFVDWWEGRVLTSNIVRAGTDTPMGSRYRFLDGENWGSVVLALGFLYNFEGAPADLLEVIPVEDAILSAWFTSVVLGEDRDYDGILVMAHMDIEDELIGKILRRIRDLTSDDMPVTFVAGHTHYRAYKKLDNYSSAIEAGGYMDTVGFISSHNAGEVLPNTTQFFHHSFMDTNKEFLRATLNVSVLDTAEGQGLSQFIEEIEKSLGLQDYIGCAPTTYKKEAEMSAKDSLTGLYFNEVIPQHLPSWNATGDLFILGSKEFEYGILKGEVLRNDLQIVIPTQDVIVKLGDDIPGWVILSLRNLEDREKAPNSILPDFLWSREAEDVELFDTYTVYTGESYVRVMSAVLNIAQSGSAGNPTEIKNVTVKSILFDFVEANWLDCPSSSRSSKSLSGGQKAGISLGVMAGVCCFCMLCLFLRNQKNEDDFNQNYHDAFEPEENKEANYT
eukprot:scaffold8419_cov62-Attheya_sp.AAC.5